MTQDEPTPTMSFVEAIPSLIPAGMPDEAAFELAISLNDADLNVREMAGYLGFIDRVYGRLISGGLRSYARRPDEQIQVTEFRAGSLEMIFQELMANADAVSATIIVGLILKYLPDVIESLASAYKDVQEGRLMSLQREQLRAKMERDNALEKLKAEEKDQLADDLISIYRIEQRALPAAGRFAEKYVRMIRMRFNDRG
jgi:hypothetical protein